MSCMTGQTAQVVLHQDGGSDIYTDSLSVSHYLNNPRDEYQLYKFHPLQGRAGTVNEKKSEVKQNNDNGENYTRPQEGVTPTVCMCKEHVAIGYKNYVCW